MGWVCLRGKGFGNERGELCLDLKFVFDGFIYLICWQLCVEVFCMFLNALGCVFDLLRGLRSE